MTKQIVNIGAADDDGTGDELRAAFDKINDNTNDLNSERNPCFTKSRNTVEKHRDYGK